MKMTKQQLKQIIKEELAGVLKEMGPEIPDAELPQGDDLDQALNVPEEVPPEVAEMGEWYAANPNASPQEIHMAWSEISARYMPGAMEE